MAQAHSPDNPCEQGCRGQTPGDVVHQDDAVVLAQGRQPCLDGSRPIGPPDHDIEPVTTTEQGYRSPALFDVRGGRHDDHVSNLATPEDAPERVSQQWLSAQRGEGLRHTSPQPHTTTGSNQDDGYVEIHR